MTRALTPPDTLSKDNIKTIADVRRHIWVQAGVGMVVGGVSGYSLHALVQVLQPYLFHNNNNNNNKKNPTAYIKLTRNTALMSVLLGSSIGSFLMAMVTGKRDVHQLHPIFEIGKVVPQQQQQQQQEAYSPTDYRIRSLTRRQQQQQHEVQHEGAGSLHPVPTTTNNNIITALDGSHVNSLVVDDPRGRLLNRDLRRKTIKKRLSHYGKVQVDDDNNNNNNNNDDDEFHSGKDHTKFTKA